MDVDTAYREYHEELIRYLVRLTGDRTVAEDLAQETFARLVGSQVKDKRSVRGWLYTVARNLVRERIRTRRVRREKGTKATLAPDESPRPDENFERRRAIARVRRALQELRPRDRQILLMREEGFDGAEIADALGVSPNSVSKMAARALRKLADVCKEMEMERRSERSGGSHAGSDERG